ncbi:MAG: hypothetical protein AAFQ64_13795 [Pseudomonadota bacterium]
MDGSEGHVALAASRRLFISGASHTGKSTFAQAVAAEAPAALISTDTLARHPGRPWPVPRPHVADFYANLAADTHATLLQHHYATLQGLIKEALAACDTSAVIIEGSALRPLVAGDGLFFCLHASDDFVKMRIYQNSGYHTADPDHRHLIDAFLARSLADQTALLAEAEKAQATLIDASNETALAAAQQLAIAYLR